MPASLFSLHYYRHLTKIEISYQSVKLNTSLVVCAMQRILKRILDFNEFIINLK